MMIAFITFKSSLVPLFEGLWSSNYVEIAWGPGDLTIGYMSETLLKPVHFLSLHSPQTNAFRWGVGEVSSVFLTRSTFYVHYCVDHDTVQK